MTIDQISQCLPRCVHLSVTILESPFLLTSKTYIFNCQSFSIAVSAKTMTPRSVAQEAIGPLAESSDSQILTEILETIPLQTLHLDQIIPSKALRTSIYQPNSTNIIIDSIHYPPRPFHELQGISNSSCCQPNARRGSFNFCSDLSKRCSIE